MTIDYILSLYLSLCHISITSSDIRNNITNDISTNFFEAILILFVVGSLILRFVLL